MFVFTHKEIFEALCILSNTGPEILINAERFSAWAELPHVVSELLKHSSFLSNSHCNTGYLTLRLYSV